MASTHSSIKSVDEVFRRFSFGSNPGNDSATSALVALGLVLNYLDCKNDNRIIPDIFEAELLKGSQWSAARYPRSNQFQKLLAKMFGSKPRATSLWGDRFAKRFNQGWLNLYWVSNIFIKCSYGGTVKDEIWQLIQSETKNNRPLIMIMRSLSISEQKLRSFAVAACGYRVSFSGRREVLVHPGIYGEENVRGSRAQTIYVPLDQVACAYHFNVMARRMEFI